MDVMNVMVSLCEIYQCSHLKTNGHEKGNIRHKLLNDEYSAYMITCDCEVVSIASEIHYLYIHSVHPHIRYR